MVVGAKSPDAARRGTNYRARFAAPGALAIGTRADINGVFQRGGY